MRCKVLSSNTYKFLLFALRLFDKSLSSFFVLSFWPWLFYVLWFFWNALPPRSESPDRPLDAVPSDNDKDEASDNRRPNETRLIVCSGPSSPPATC